MSKLSAYEHAVRALVYTDSPEKQRRVVTETANRSLLSRVVINHAYGFIYKHPDFTQRLLSTPYRRKGLNVIAFGRNSTVFRQADSVIKIARASEDMPDHQRHSLVDELDRRHAASKAYLGSMCIDQSFEIIRHPLRDSRVVAATQPFTDFRPYRLGMELTAIQQSQLTAFARLSQDMEKSTGLVSDVSGTDNLGFSATDQLVLVDTIPLQGSDGGPSVELARQVLAELAIPTTTPPL